MLGISEKSSLDKDHDAGKRRHEPTSAFNLSFTRGAAGPRTASRSSASCKTATASSHHRRNDISICMRTESLTAKSPQGLPRNVVQYLNASVHREMSKVNVMSRWCDRHEERGSAHAITARLPAELMVRGENMNWGRQRARRSSTGTL